MRRILLFSFLCFLAIATNSCKKARLRAQLKELMGNTVVLPDSLLCVYHGAYSRMPDSLHNKPKLIVFVDSTECSQCRISRFVLYEELFQTANRTHSFVPIILLTTKKAEYNDIIDHLLLIDLFCPVYLDDAFMFRKMNPFIPNDVRFQSLFLDKNNQICLVGDPSINDGLIPLYLNFINPYYEKDID